MVRTYIRKSKRNPDFYQVISGHKIIGEHLHKKNAQIQADAKRRVIIKREMRKKKG